MDPTHDQPRTLASKAMAELEAAEAAEAARRSAAGATAPVARPVPSAQPASGAARAGDTPVSALEAARRRAERACLSRQGLPGSPVRPTGTPPAAMFQPGTLPGDARTAPLAGGPATGLTLPAPTDDAARPAAPPPRLGTLPPPVAPAPPLTLNGCDATGCWASDGSRLQRSSGGALLGPRGFCHVNGNLLQCP